MDQQESIQFQLIHNAGLKICNNVGLYLQMGYSSQLTIFFFGLEISTFLFQIFNKVEIHVE